MLRRRPEERCAETLRESVAKENVPPPFEPAPWPKTDCGSTVLPFPLMSVSSPVALESPLPPLMAGVAGAAGVDCCRFDWRAASFCARMSAGTWISRIVTPPWRSTVYSAPSRSRTVMRVPARVGLARTASTAL